MIKTRKTLVSIGTEKNTVLGTKDSLISRVRKQPEKLIKVYDLIKENGLKDSLEKISNQFDQTFPLGYCNAGVVVKIGEDISDLKLVIE